MELTCQRTFLSIDIAKALHCAHQRKARNILDRADGDTDIAVLAMHYLRHPEFRLWYIPPTFTPFFEQCIADLMRISEASAPDGLPKAPEAAPADAPYDESEEIEEDACDAPMTRAQASAYIRSEFRDAIGYLGMVGPVLCSMEIGCTVEGWGQGHGIGTQIIQHMQQNFAKRGLLALNVTGGQHLLTNCGFTKLPLPAGVTNAHYDERPFMAWNMSPKRIARVMQRYGIAWEQR